VLTCHARIDGHILVPEARDTTEPKTGDESHYGEHPGSVLNAANALKRLKSVVTFAGWSDKMT
jgi:sugar/nucleoside kinase (ribokinase family)